MLSFRYLGTSRGDMLSRYYIKVYSPEKKVKSSLMCPKSGFPRNNAEAGSLFTSFIEDMLSEKRS